MAARPGETDLQWLLRSQGTTMPVLAGEGEGSHGIASGNMDPSIARATQQLIAAMRHFGVTNVMDLPYEVRAQIATATPETGYSVFKDSILPGIIAFGAGYLGATGLEAAGAGGAAAGAGGSSAAGGALASDAALAAGAAGGAAGTAGGGLTAAQAAGTVGGLVSGGAATAGTAGGVGGATASDAALAAGASGGAAGTAGGGLTAAQAAGNGAGMSGFLGLSSGDWVNLGTQLYSGITSKNAADKAAAGQTAASEAAIAENRRQFDTTRSDLMPWLTAGKDSISRIRDLLGLSGKNITPEQVMEMDPGYQFRLGEGNKAIMNASRAAGTSQSPSTVKALLRYGQDYATDAYDRIFNRFSGVAGTGQTAGTNIGQFGANSANTVGGLMTGAANARGAAGIAGANALGGAAQNIGNWYQNNQMMDRRFPRGR